MKKLLIVIPVVLISFGSLFSSCKKTTELSLSNIGSNKKHFRSSNLKYQVGLKNGFRVDYYLNDEVENSISYDVVIVDSNEINFGEYQMITTESPSDYNVVYKDGGTVLTDVTFEAGTFPGDCNKLGGRKSNESFDDCFGRNWFNFCCDVSGCLAQGAFPLTVGTAIALSCAAIIPGEVSLESIYDMGTSSYIYQK